MISPAQLVEKSAAVTTTILAYVNQTESLGLALSPFQQQQFEQLVAAVEAADQIAAVLGHNLRAARKDAESWAALGMAPPTLADVRETMTLSYR